MDQWLSATTLLFLAVAAGAAGASTACGVNMVFTIAAHQSEYPWWRVSIPYAIGSVVGAVMVGLAISSAGAAFGYLLGPATHRLAATGVIAVAAIALGLREVGRLSFALPQRRSQVNSDALDHPGVSRRMFAFGLWLGAAFLTYSPYGGLYLLGIATFMVASVPLGTALFGMYGLARALTVIVAGSIPATWSAAAHFGDRIAAADGGARALTALSIAGAGLGAVVAYLR